VHPYVAFGVVLRRLRDAFHARDFGQHFGEEAGFIEQLKGAAGVAFGEHLGKLVADTLAADCVNARGESADGGVSGGFDFKSEARGEADGAQQAELVFLKAALGGGRWRG
jgi:hypothetical protein